MIFLTLASLSLLYLAVAGADIETTPNEFQIIDEATSAAVWNSMADGR